MNKCLGMHKSCFYTCLAKLIWDLIMCFLLFHNVYLFREFQLRLRIG